MIKLIPLQFLNVIVYSNFVVNNLLDRYWFVFTLQVFLYLHSTRGLFFYLINFLT